MTELTAFQRKIADFFPEISLCFEEPLKNHTSFRIGGPAEVMAFPKNSGELGQLLNKSVLLDCKPVILGAGTNVLAPDEGLRGLVICLKDCLDGLVRVDETHIRAMAGVTMTRLAMFAAREGLSGLEFAHGIPGSVGGGVYMNAGAYGGEMGRVCESAELMTVAGEIYTLQGGQMDFSYRHSCLENSGDIVLTALFSLTPDDPEAIVQVMEWCLAHPQEAATIAARGEAAARELTWEANAKKYLERMAEVTEIGLGIVSVGPNRDETIVIAKDIF